MTTKPHKILLSVIIEASDKKTALDMIEQLCRSACDVANSTDDDEAHIWVENHTYELA